MIIINYNKSRFSKKYIKCPKYKLLHQLVRICTNSNISSNLYKTIALNIEICDKLQIIKLNKQYRHKNSPTNVISLEYSIENHYLTGDIFLCHEVIKTEARQQHKKILDHYCHLIIHGLLHLQGFDHIQEDDANKMELIEIQILNSIGIKNPYMILQD